MITDIQKQIIEEQFKILKGNVASLERLIAEEKYAAAKSVANQMATTLADFEIRCERQQWQSGE